MFADLLIGYDCIVEGKIDLADKAFSHAPVL